MIVSLIAEMKTSYVAVHVVFYIFIYHCQMHHVKTDTIPVCSLHNSTLEIINTYEGKELSQLIKIVSSKNVQNSISCFSTDNKVANISDQTYVSFENSVNELIINITVKRLGGASIECICNKKYQNNTLEVLKIIVERENTIQEIIFRIMILTFVVLITFVMGCSIELKIIWQYMKKPIAPTIGLLSQFVIMPLLAFGISKLINISNEFAFGLLTVGCSPGGSGSNIWTVLLKGDLNLSMTMTFISTIMALAMMPFWMFCLGRYFLDYKLIKIPYLFIFFNLVQVVVPAICGVLFRWKWENKAMKIIRITKFLALGFIIFILTFGIYANLYMYLLIFDYPYLIPIASMLPWLGFLFGFISGIITGQGFTKSLTISIEVGIQNIGIAILILKFSMPKPLGDMAAIIPIIVAVVTPFPLMFGYIGDLILKKIFQKPKKSNIEKHSLSEIPIKPTYSNIDVVDAKLITKQSTIEPTLYYCEELSSYFGESSPSLG